MGMRLLIILLIIIQCNHAQIWSSTTIHCLWNEHTTNHRLGQRIDLRDIRNQLLKYVVHIISFRMSLDFLV